MSEPSVITPWEALAQECPRQKTAHDHLTGYYIHAVIDPKKGWGCFEAPAQSLAGTEWIPNITQEIAWKWGGGNE